MRPLRLFGRILPASRLLSWGLSKTVPLPTSPSASTPGCPGSELATAQTRSALAVLPGFGGLLRSWFRELVASRCQLWDSLGFVPTTDQSRYPTLHLSAFTLRSVSLLVGRLPCRQGPFPLAVSLTARKQFAAASGLCSYEKSVAPLARCPMLPWACLDSWLSPSLHPAAARWMLSEESGPTPKCCG